MRLSVVLFRFFISLKDSHKKSRDRLTSARSDSSVALAVHFPAFGLIGLLCLRLCGLFMANCQCILLSCLAHSCNRCHGSFQFLLFVVGAFR